MRAFAHFLWLTAPAFAGDVYVDPIVGDDTNSGTLATDPVATITRALQVAGTGDLTDIDQIWLAPGTYGPGETFPLIVGSFQRLIGAGSGSSVIDGGVAPLCIEIAPTSSVGTFEESALHLRDLAVIGAGIGVQHVSVVGGPILNLKVDRCRFQTQQDGIDMDLADLGIYRAEIRDSLFTGNSVGVDQVLGKIIAGNLVIEDCVFLDNGTGIISENDFSAPSNFVDVRRTRIVGANTGISVSQVLVGQHLLVEDSLIVPSFTGISGVIESITVDRCTITGAQGFGISGAARVRNSILYGNNIDYNGTFGTFSTNNIIGSGPPGLLAINSQEDPRFRDPSQGDYRLSSSSPAIDQAPAAGGDVTGFDRARADGDLDTVVLSDLGAYEFRVLDGPVTGSPGTTFDLDLQVIAPEFAWVVTASLAAQPVATGFGGRWLDLTGTVGTVGVVLAPTSLSVSVPNDPALVGTTLSFQALVRSPLSTTGAAWSNPVSVSVE